MSVWQKVSVSLAVAATSLALGAASMAQETGSHTKASTILVFDVSNSMWGQIDGVSKIEIARDVIGDMVRDWDEDVDLGLVAYGHRRKGDCSDIEAVIPEQERKEFMAKYKAAAGFAIETLNNAPPTISAGDKVTL